MVCLRIAHYKRAHTGPEPTAKHRLQFSTTRKYTRKLDDMAYDIQAHSQRVAHIITYSVSSSILNLFILQLNKLFYDPYANRLGHNSFFYYAHFICAFPSSNVTSQLLRAAISDSIERIFFGVTFAMSLA